MDGKIFISHSSKDREYGDVLVNDIRRNDPWICHSILKLRSIGMKPREHEHMIRSSCLELG